MASRLCLQRVRLASKPDTPLRSRRADPIGDTRVVPMADLRARLRAFALSLPGAAEDFPWGERVAKVNGKIFVFLGHDDASSRPPLMTVKLVESHEHALTLEGAGPTATASDVPGG
jgi:hypothetical protein